MTLADALQAYVRAMAERHLRQFLRFELRNAANDNRGWVA